MSGGLKNKTFRGMIWSCLERFSVQGVQFLVMIFMARMLTPEDYGLVGMLTIFIAISQSLIDSGFSQALIRKQNRTDIDNSTVFYFNIIVGLLLYLCFFISAPLIASFYKKPLLIAIMRVISLGIVFNSFAVVQRALLTANIDFKTQAKASFIAALVSGGIGIWMAYSGFGVWSIVVLQIVNYGINTLLLWVLSEWRPVIGFSWISFMELFSFGSKLLVAGFLNTIYNNLYLLVIGKFFSAEKLGHYTRAHQFSDFPSSNLTGIFQRVTYPVLCELQNEDDRLALNYRKLLKLSAFIIFPLMCGLAAVSKPFITVVLGEQWSYTAIILQVICFAMMWYPVHAINLNLLQVKGRSDLFLRLEIVKKIIGIIILCITLPMGLIVMCYGQIISSVVSLIINTYYTGKLIGVGFVRQMCDLFPTLLVCVLMFLIVWSTCSLINNYKCSLICGIIVGAIFYTITCYVFNFEEEKVLISLLGNKHGRK